MQARSVSTSFGARKMDMNDGSRVSSFIREFYQPIGFPVLQAGLGCHARVIFSMQTCQNQVGVCGSKDHGSCCRHSFQNYVPLSHPWNCVPDSECVHARLQDSDWSNSSAFNVRRTLIGARLQLPTSTTKFPEFTHSQVLRADNSEHVLLVSTLGLPTLVWMYVPYQCKNTDSKSATRSDHENRLRDQFARVTYAKSNQSGENLNLPVVYVLPNFGVPLSTCKVRSEHKRR
jgi:hypothetical protein